MKKCITFFVVTMMIQDGISTTCDIMDEAGTPCVAAHSTVRALYASFNGSLYSIKRASDSTSFDVRVAHVGGFSDSASHDAFCENTTCVFDRIYDQSPNQNHLGIAPAGGMFTTTTNPTPIFQVPTT